MYKVSDSYDSYSRLSAPHTNSDQLALHLRDIAEGRQDAHDALLLCSVAIARVRYLERQAAGEPRPEAALSTSSKANVPPPGAVPKLPQEIFNLENGP